ncbi:hypothetical protein CYY_003534 [Polysphondylium violaceum]|uniref:Phospholipid-transporting ATPase n=1 Tax=Polysphondylium violaceum TaxID=133409 RepID=A0A8J4PZI1_9MYCE|nr:hypothetical protein CYY_003534 [Polysphondylium violaceum]
MSNDFNHAILQDTDSLGESVKSTNPLLIGVGYEQECEEFRLGENEDMGYDDDDNENGGGDDEMDFIDLDEEENEKTDNHHHNRRHQHHQRQQKLRLEDLQSDNQQPPLTASSQLFTTVPLYSPPTTTTTTTTTTSNTNKHARRLSAIGAKLLPSSLRKENTDHLTSNTSNTNHINHNHSNSNSNHNNSNQINQQQRQRSNSYQSRPNKKEKDSRVQIIKDDNEIDSEEEKQDSDDENQRDGITYDKSKNKESNESKKSFEKSPVYIHKQHSSQVPEQYLSILKASYGVVQKKKRAAIALKVGRKWLTNIIIIQTFGNLIRALPIFVLEKYYVMLLIFFQALFLVIGSYGVKRLKKYLILLYSIGCFVTTILDLIITFTFAHTQDKIPFNEGQLAFWTYVVFVSLLCTLNFIGGIVLGLKLFVSVVTLKDPSQNSLVLLAASLVGSFETSEDDEEEEANKLSQKANRCIFFYGSDVKKAMATTSSISKNINMFDTLKQSVIQSYQQLAGKTGAKTTTPRSAVPTSQSSSHLLTIKSNAVITSKYNILTFLPKVIFFQFSRLANLYTLCIVILCMFSFSPVGPISSFTPLLVVIAVSCFKEFAEDVKRHKQDKEINNREAYIYRPPFYQEDPSSNFDDDSYNILSKIPFLRAKGTESTVPLYQNQSSVGIYQKCRWRDIKVGDIILVKDGELLPADIVCISTSRSDGRTYLETANLDGETNLKVKNNIQKCSWIKKPEDLDNFICKLDYEGPNNDIYAFDGVLTILKGLDMSQSLDNSVTGSVNYSPVSIDNLLLRGTKLRNTDWVLGIVAYTGVDTKVEKNSTKINQKRSSVERGVNNKLLILFLLQTIICIICSIGHNRWHLEDDNTAKPWYMGDQTNTNSFIYVSYVILYNTLIPLSMYVSMEVIRVSNAHFIDSDLELYSQETDTPAQARNTNINEELGQIQYIFSDKTGTLTCNEMVFNQCTIGGQVYGPHESSLTLLRLGYQGELSSSTVSQSSLGSSTNNALEMHTPNQYIKEFLLCLALCNTVIIEKKGKEGADLDYSPTSANSIPTYQASSPDEEALTITAAKYGFILKSREGNIVTISIHGRDEKFEVLNLLEFNSYRKRMSVIVRTEQGQIKLYCKGADSVIFERSIRDEALIKTTEKHLSDFASNGLRTLCMSVKVIEQQDYIFWSKKYQEASVSLSKKAEKVDRACELIETDLHLIGATGIEDRLQDNVPDTIEAFREAGIKVWVLTGDKQETAISIATSSAVISNDMEIHILNESSKEDLMSRLLDISERKKLYQKFENTGNWGPKFFENMAKMLRLNPEDAPNLLTNKNENEPPQHMAIVIDGSTLALALHPDLRYYFLQVAKTCESVVCCRCSPSQKAKVVNLVAERSFLFGDGAITLSIGDGANDVPMIRKAHIGVGISGREGMQAVLASDFSIANFSMLKRLILVHGNRSYKRMTKLILYSFSKNIALSISQFWFGFFSGFSGQMIYFDFLFTLYNALFTSLPVLTLGTFDQDTKEEDLLNNPNLYRICQSNKPFSTLNFIWWVFIGMWQSAVTFFITFFVLQTATVDGGKTLGLWSMGTAAYLYLVLIVNLQISFITRYWTKSNILTVSLSVVASFLFVMLYSVLYIVEPSAYHIIFELFSVVDFWFLLIIVPAVALLPYIIVSLNGWLFSSDEFKRRIMKKKHGFIQMNDL